MHKIPTIFIRDFTNNGKITRDWHPDCFAVRDGLTTATVKYDGSCCMIRDGRLYKRYELQPGRAAPAGFESSGEPDSVTGRQTGWLVVGMGPDDQWHREALDTITDRSTLADGTYELCGPKVQGNPNKIVRHILIPHGVDVVSVKPYTYESLQQYLTSTVHEGIVFWRDHKPVGKIKRRDFGLPWPVKG